MRHTLTGLLVGLALIQTIGAQSSRYPVQEKETIQKTLEFSGTANRMIELDNVSGSIHVSSTTGRSVEMVANKTINAESKDRVADAQRNVKLDITDKAETVRIYVDGPFRCNCSDGRNGWRSNGNHPGYDVESKAGWGELLFVEVKGRVVGASTVTITRNEILTGLNKGDHYILGLVRVSPDDSAEVRYLYDPFMGQDDALIGVASVNYEFDHFWQRAEAPR